MCQVTPRLRPEDEEMTTRPWIDDFSSNYMQRVMHRFPKQGDRAPWLNSQNYSQDKKMLRRSPIEDGVLQFSQPADSLPLPHTSAMLPLRILTGVSLVAILAWLWRNMKQE
jgi:hypothetical protein